MRKYLVGVAVLLLLASNPAPADEGVTPILKMDTTYHFMFFSQATPAASLPGRPAALWASAWEGTVKGDINGVIRWWVELPSSAVGRWEIWDCEPVYPASDCNDPAKLIMAGYDVFASTTESGSEWAGKGIVTYVGAAYLEEFGGWYGRRITDGGWVDYVGGLPSYGEGWFTILNKPSNKH